MKKIILLFILTLSSLFASNTSSGFDYQSKSPLLGKSILITLTSTENLKLGMGMHLSMSALNKGAKVYIFTGANVVPFLKKNGAPNTTFVSSGKKISNVFKTFISKGGKVFICAACAKHFHLKQKDVIEGVKIIHSKKYYDLLFYQTNKNIEF